jgi:hypothetical protein
LTLCNPKIRLASKGHSLQTLSSRIGKKTEFDFLQLEGEIAENVIKNIENAKKYLKQTQNPPLDIVHP